jgi:3-methyladenine DNA glycosylase AlkC
MARLHIDSEAAFAQLGQWATRDNRKLRTVAEELVTSFQTSLARPRSDDNESTVIDPWHADHAL